MTTSSWKPVSWRSRWGLKRRTSPFDADALRKWITTSIPATNSPFQTTGFGQSVTIVQAWRTIEPTETTSCLGVRRQHNSGFDETTTTERCTSPNNGSTTNTSDDATERRANVLFRGRAGFLRRGGRCSDPDIMTSHNDVIKYFSQNLEGLIFHFSIQTLESYTWWRLDRKSVV